LHYLERFDSSSANLRRVLMRRFHKLPDIPDEAASMVDAVVAKLVGLGYVDDRRYAQAKVGALRAKGASVRKVQAGLAAKGVDTDLIHETLADLDEQGEESEMKAAAIYARKRRLGPFRQVARAAFRDKDLAAMGRAGFGWQVAKRIIDQDDG